MENMEPNRQINVPQNNTAQFYSYGRKSPAKNILIILAVVVLVLIVGGVYAHVMKIWPFSIAPYTEKNLLSGILNASSKIKSSSYSASFSFEMGKRDADAKPFVTELSNIEEVKKRYNNDFKRAQDTSALLAELRFDFKNGYPASLESLRSTLNKKYSYSSYYKPVSIKDPLTQQTYSYALTDGGKNFVLTIVLETNNAISEIKRSYNFNTVATTINGKTVTFTKDSGTYVYFSSTPPEPFLVEVANYLTYVPSEVKVSAGVSAQADWSNKDSSDWKFNADATGDFGDLTYKANVDLLRKDNLYYFRINNLPSLFFVFINLQKGQWIKIDLAGGSDDSYGYNMFSGLLETEKYFKENREELSNLLRKMVETADSKNLISLKSAPYINKINGKNFYRYDLQIRKESIVSFYQELQKEVEKTSIKNRYPVLLDSGYLEYLQSPEFSEAFDYYQKNTSLSLWVDSQGFPVSVSYSARIVPQDEVVQLKDKQGNLIFKLELSEINKSVNIEAPNDSKDLQEILNLDPYIRSGKDASIKANMTNLMTYSAVYYDDYDISKSSYDKWCSSEDYYDVKDAIDKAYGSGSKVVCSCENTNCTSAQKWCASALLLSGKYYCVDSSGIKKESSNLNVCFKGVCGS